MMVRWMCGVTLKCRITSEELRHRLNIESVYDVVRRGRLRWFGHVDTKDDDWVRRCRRLEVKGKAGGGRGGKTWFECVKEDKKELGLTVDDTKDRLQWRRFF